MLAYELSEKTENTDVAAEPTCSQVKACEGSENFKPRRAVKINFIKPPETLKIENHAPSPYEEVNVTSSFSRFNLKENEAISNKNEWLRSKTLPLDPVVTKLNLQRQSDFTERSSASTHSRTLLPSRSKHRTGLSFFNRVQTQGGKTSKTVKNVDTNGNPSQANSNNKSQDSEGKDPSVAIIFQSVKASLILSVLLLFFAIAMLSYLTAAVAEENSEADWATIISGYLKNSNESTNQTMVSRLQLMSELLNYSKLLHKNRYENFSSNPKLRSFLANSPALANFRCGLNLLNLSFIDASRIMANNETCYYYSTVTGKFDYAETFCSKLNGSLVTMTDLKNITFVNNRALGFSIKNSWIGQEVNITTCRISNCTVWKDHESVSEFKDCKESSFFTCKWGLYIETDLLHEVSDNSSP